MTDKKTIEDQRREYIKIRTWAIYDDQTITPEQFDRCVKEKAGIENMTPEKWIEVAAGMRTRCNQCSGTGDYAVGVENGRRKVRGICFRCEGRGFQTHADRVRNDAYDRLNFHSAL